MFAITVAVALQCGFAGRPEDSFAHGGSAAGSALLEHGFLPNASTWSASKWSAEQDSLTDVITPSSHLQTSPQSTPQAEAGTGDWVRVWRNDDGKTPEPGKDDDHEQYKHGFGSSQDGSTQAENNDADEDEQRELKGTQTTGDCKGDVTSHWEATDNEVATSWDGMNFQDYDFAGREGLKKATEAVVLKSIGMVREGMATEEATLGHHEIRQFQKQAGKLVIAANGDNMQINLIMPIMFEGTCGVEVEIEKKAGPGGGIMMKHRKCNFQEPTCDPAKAKPNDAEQLEKAIDEGDNSTKKARNYNGSDNDGDSEEPPDKVDKIKKVEKVTGGKGGAPGTMENYEQYQTQETPENDWFDGKPQRESRSFDIDDDDFSFDSEGDGVAPAKRKELKTEVAIIKKTLDKNKDTNSPLILNDDELANLEFTLKDKEEQLALAEDDRQRAKKRHEDRKALHKAREGEHRQKLLLAEDGSRLPQHASYHETHNLGTVIGAKIREVGHELSDTGTNGSRNLQAQAKAAVETSQHYSRALDEMHMSLRGFDEGLDKLRVTAAVQQKKSSDKITAHFEAAIDQGQHFSEDQGLSPKRHHSAAREAPSQGSTQDQGQHVSEVEDTQSSRIVNDHIQSDRE